MRKRLAITVAGAVSLGSYEAGVLYEIVEALRQHNEDPQTTEDEKIEIDVLTGASAGGMTAVIAAQKLLFDAPALRDPKNNSFREPWVEDIDLLPMLNYDKDENPFASFFSSNLIGRIAEKHLLARYKTATPPTPKPHPAAAETIRLGLALSNLNGVDYERKLVNYGTFTYTRFQDELTRTLSRGDDNRSTWEPLKTAALSCGAFPFAFRLVELLRTNRDYEAYRYFVKFPEGEVKHAFTDGGTFQNEPLGLAKRLVGERDKPEDEPSRFYLFVAPGAKTGTNAAKPTGAGKPKPQFNAEANMAKTGLRLVSAIFSQARFHDWIMAQDVNERIRLFNSRAQRLQQDIMTAAGNPSFVDWRSLRPAADALLPVLFPKGPEISSPSSRHRSVETLDEARDRLRGQFAREYGELVKFFESNPVVANQAAETWLDAIVAFEKAAELHGKDEMHIYGITATNEELSGELLGSFGGFFDHRFREHDYLVGRAKAQEFLAKLNPPGAFASADGLGPIRYTPSPIPAIPEKEIKMADLDKRRRQEFGERILSRASRALEEAGLSSMIVAPLRWWFLRPKLNKFLKL